MSLPPILELEQLDNTLTSLEPIEDSNESNSDTTNYNIKMLSQAIRDQNTTDVNTYLLKLIEQDSDDLTSLFSKNLIDLFFYTVLLEANSLSDDKESEDGVDYFQNAYTSINAIINNTSLVGQFPFTYGIGNIESRNYTFIIYILYEILYKNPNDNDTATTNISEIITNSISNIIDDVITIFENFTESVFKNIIVKGIQRIGDNLEDETVETYVNEISVNLRTTIINNSDNIKTFFLNLYNSLTSLDDTDTILHLYVSAIVKSIQIVGSSVLNFYQINKNIVETLISQQNSGRDTGENVSFTDTTYEEFKMRRKAEYLKHDPLRRNNYQQSRNYLTKKNDYARIAKSSTTKYRKMTNNKIKEIKPVFDTIRRARRSGNINNDNLSTILNNSQCSNTIILSNPGTNSGIYNSRTMLFLNPSIRFHSSL